MNQEKDAVEKIIEQWQRERSELALEHMLTIGRLKRCAALVGQRLEEEFSKHDLTTWEFDVLATLRRAGAPYCLTPTQLFSTMMITSGTMTHRMQRLQKRGLIERIDNPDDARSKQVRLSEAGFTCIERAVTGHVANEAKILAPFDVAQREALDKALANLLAVLE